MTDFVLVEPVFVRFEKAGHHHAVDDVVVVVVVVAIVHDDGLLE